MSPLSFYTITAEGDPGSAPKVGLSMATVSQPLRCHWVQSDRAIDYHDNVWGKAVHDPKTLLVSSACGIQLASVNMLMHGGSCRCTSNMLVHHRLFSVYVPSRRGCPGESYGPRERHTKAAFTSLTTCPRLVLLRTSSSMTWPPTPKHLASWQPSQAGCNSRQCSHLSGD